MRVPRVSNGAARSAALFVLAGLLAAAGLWVALTRIGGQEASQPLDRLELVTGGGVRTIDIEIAATPEQQALGLMFRSSLPDGRGMLFPHGKPEELTMWMRNTYIPLDLVFIRADGTVHRIEANAEPLSERIIPSNGPVAAVLELAGGAAGRLGLKPGDTVRHRYFAKPPR